VIVRVKAPARNAVAGVADVRAIVVQLNERFGFILDFYCGNTSIFPLAIYCSVLDIRPSRHIPTFLTVGVQSRTRYALRAIPVRNKTSGAERELNTA
jgi:hypothetical protein